VAEEGKNRSGGDPPTKRSLAEEGGKRVLVGDRGRLACTSTGTSPAFNFGPLVGISSHDLREEAVFKNHTGFGIREERLSLPSSS
jgi:hypothetical protein